jgi:hypothetical protein
VLETELFRPLLCTAGVGTLIGPTFLLTLENSHRLAKARRGMVISDCRPKKNLRTLFFLSFVAQRPPRGQPNYRTLQSRKCAVWVENWASSHWEWSSSQPDMVAAVRWGAGIRWRLFRNVTFELRRPFAVGQVTVHRWTNPSTNWPTFGEHVPESGLDHRGGAGYALRARPTTTKSRFVLAARRPECVAEIGIL